VSISNYFRCKLRQHLTKISSFVNMNLMLNIMSGYFPGIHYWGIFNEGPVEINRKIIYYNFFFIIILVKCYNETHEQGCLSFHLYLNENILYFLKSLIERLLFEYMINHR
jgi:hypothetical protein